MSIKGVRSRGVLLVTVFVSLLGIMGCGQGQSAPSVAPVSASAEPGGLKPLSPSVKVKIAEDGSASGAAFYIALAKGYFKAQGIEAEIVNFQSSADMLPALASGQIQAAGGIVSLGLFNSIARGIDVKIAADKGTNRPGNSYFSMVVRKDLADQVKELKDLKGKRIITYSLESVNEEYIARVLTKAGLAWKDADVKGGFGGAEMLAAVAANQADLAVLTEPEITQGTEKGIWVRFQDLYDILGPAQNGVVLASPQFMQNKELSGRFMIAYLQGARDYSEAFFKGGKNRDEVIKIMTQYTEMKDPALWTKVKLAGISGNGYVLTKQVQGTLDWFRTAGYFKAEIDLNKVIDHSAVDFALNQLGKFPE